MSNKVWTSKLIDEYNDRFTFGIDLDNLGDSPYYNNMFGWRKGDILFKYTPQEFDEIVKCKNDVLYFADHYAFAMTDAGVQKIELRNYQRKILKGFQHNRYSIYVASRQVGKTIMAGIFIAWYLCFHYDRNVLVVANKMQTTNEIVTKIKHVIQNLPFFLKPGVRGFGVTGLAFDNGCRLISSATTPTAGIGFANHLVYADEFAYVHDNISERFFKSIFPTLVSSKISRMILTSTPNGKNLFYRIYKGALNKTNEFKALRTDWWEVPGRDETWKKREIANLGSEEIFNQEYGNSFDVSTKMLADSHTIKFFEKLKTKFEWYKIDSLESEYYSYEHLKWHPKYFKSLTNDDKFVVSIDMGSGIGGDYSVINIFKVIRMNFPKILNYNGVATGEDDFFSLVQVGMFRDNYTSNAEVAYLTGDLVMNYLLPENTTVVLEMNHRGEEFKKDLEMYRPDSLDFSIFFKGIERSIKGNRKIMTDGIRVGKEKFEECKKLAKDWSNKRIILTEKNTFSEVTSFGLNDKNTSYEGLGTHDDIIMTTYNARRIFGTLQFTDLIYEEINGFTQSEYNLIQYKMVTLD